MAPSVVIAASVVVTLLILQLPECSCQCFKSLNCVGTIIVPLQSSLRECCVNTDDGLSWSSGDGSCTNCIVHGFSSVEYRINEGNFALIRQFDFFVKGGSLGITPTFGIMPGLIRSVAVTAKDGPDYRFSDVSTYKLPAEWRVDIEDDYIALEYDDQLNLVYYPRPFNLIARFEADGQFVRSNVPVYIDDNDLLVIYFDERDYSTVEGDTTGYCGISLSLRETQAPFSIEIIPTTIDVARTQYNLSHHDQAAENLKAKSGADFNNVSFTIEVPAKTASVTISSIAIVDDDINERTEFFVLVAKVLDRAADVACFQLDENNSPCNVDGHIGETELIIRDNDDDMYIGFSERYSVVRENMFPSFLQFPIPRTIHSLRESEIDYDLIVRLTHSTATVTSFTSVIEAWDVRFGDLFGNFNTTPSLLLTLREANVIYPFIHNDLDCEANETFTLRVYMSDTSGPRPNFKCYEDGETPVEGNYYCSHTVTIVDEDEPLLVSFEHTLYEVAETEGQVEVCVVLTRPDTDILDNVVGVEVFEDFFIKTNEYFPSGAAVANGDPPYLDYEKQEFGFNELRSERISEFHRKICYNQTVYDDMRLEAVEYAGLTLEVQDLEAQGGPTTIKTYVDIEHAAIRIVDNDVARVGFEQKSYKIDEAVGTVEICAVVHEPNTDCPIDLEFSVSCETTSATAVTPGDYEEITAVFTFSSCETRKCMNVTIVNDNIAERNEYFRVTLSRVANSCDSRIVLKPQITTVKIRDNDG